jgi:sulfate adenylyltransferase subunit 1
MHADRLDGAKTYLLKHTSQTVKATVTLRHRTDIETLENHAATVLEMNEIGVAVIETSRPVMVDPYRDNHVTGSFILIDPATNATVCAGMVRVRLAAEIEQRSTSAVIVLGTQQALLQELEQRLLAQRYAVVTTHVTNRAVWESLLRAGVITLVACDDCESPSIAFLRHQGLVFDSLDLDPQGEHSSAEQIEHELHRRNIFPKTTEDVR